MSLVGQVLAQGTVIVKSIVIEGRQNISEAGILSAMKSTPGSPLSQAQVLQDETSIRDLGFFEEVKILTRMASESEADLVVQVKENPIVREYRIVGNTIVSTEELLAAVQAVQPAGQVYNNRNARVIRDAVSAIYTDKGYFVDFTELGPSADSPGTLTVAILETRVNKITIEGLVRTREAVLRRIMKTKPGDAYSPRLWRNDLEELYYTYWFETLDNRELPGEEPGTIDLSLVVKEARTGQVGAGVALDPQSRLVGTLNYSDTNFLGRGENVGVFLSQAATGGGISAELSYGNRFFDANDTSMNVRLFSRVVYNFTGTGSSPFETSSDDDRFDERRTGGSVSFARPLGGPYRGTLGLSAQRIETINLTAAADSEFIQQDGDLVTLQLGFDRDLRRPRQEPFSGELARLTIEPGFSNITEIGGNVASDTDVLGRNTFVRTTLDYRRYWSKRMPEDTPIDTPRPVLAFRATGGVITGTVPFFEQLFVGGTGSLRGYPNQRFWGSKSFLTTLEYRYPVQKSFNLIGFVDYGGAWDGYGKLRDFQQSDSPELKLGYGLGLSFRTPLGPIRIDFGFSQEGDSRTHFAFGTSF